jgi:DNA-binding transcriptional MerR regulator
MSDFFRTHDFAALAGVTVKALRHYERVGLLKPRRTRAGHRRYGRTDLERLEAIAALKYLGFPLDRIRSILNRPAGLPNELDARRAALLDEESRLTISRRAMDAAGGASSPDAALDAIVETVQNQVAAAAMKKYYTEEGWQRRQRYYEEGPSPEWRELYRELAALADEDPASDAVQAAADRWLALSWRAYTGDPAVQTDSMRAWANREHWPARLKRRIEEFNLEGAHALIAAAAQAAPKKYFTPRAWERYLDRRNGSPESISRAWQAKVALFRDIEAALDSGAADNQAAELRARWDEQLEGGSGGDPEVHDALLKMWADRDRWSASLRWQIETIHCMTYERIQRVADFLDRAAAIR